jgi:ABC-type glycerol-3-phosphate transport system permease component
MATQSHVLGELGQVQSKSQTGRSPVNLERILLYVAMSLLAVLFMFPFFWTVTSSLKRIDELYVFPPQFLPEVPQWQNYARVLESVPFLRWAWNSLLVVLLNTSGTVLTAALAAYAFARFRFRGREVIFILTLGTLMLPAQVTLIPQYVLFHKLNWINTLRPLWVPAWFGGNAFAIFLLRQFMLSIPKELDEAALIDGASYPRIFTRILLPLCKPVLATITVITFNDVWNDFVNPVIYLQLPEKFTLAAGLNYFRTVPEVGGEPTQHLLLAASVMVILPVIVLFFATQRYFVRGIVLTGIKG